MTVAEARAEVLRRTPRSRALYESGFEVLCLLGSRRLSVPYPIFVKEAHGSHVWDVDGNEYVDLTMGFGPHVLGYSPPVVVEAVREAVARGTQWSLYNPYQEPLARLLVEAVPCAEKVIFCNSGTEATMHAMRAARGCSGKTRVALFEGCYHGAHDYCLVRGDRSSPRERPSFSRIGSGVPDEIAPTLLMLPYRSDAAFDLIRRHADELALVLVEPVQSSVPRADHGPWLRRLREACSEEGVLLGFDEVYTGFRLAYGGAQEYFGVVPDLATYGKIIGGGLPVGAVAGRADVMDVFVRASDALPRAEGAPPRHEIFWAGTFSGNPLTMSAGLAAVTYLTEHPEVYSHLHEQSHRLARAINGFCEDEEIPAEVIHAESSMFLYIQPRGTIETWRDVVGFDEGPRGEASRGAADALYLHLLRRGVIIPGIHGYVLSSAHSAEDVDHVIASITESLAEIKGEGFFEPVQAAA